jgi:hypothetical protein
MMSVIAFPYEVPVSIAAGLDAACQQRSPRTLDQRLTISIMAGV